MGLSRSSLVSLYIDIRSSGFRFSHRITLRFTDALAASILLRGFRLQLYVEYVRAPARAPHLSTHHGSAPPRGGVASTRRTERPSTNTFFMRCVSHRTKVPQHDVKKFRSPCWVRRPPELPRDVCGQPSPLSAVSRALPLCHWPPPLRQRSWSETRPRREP